MTCRTMTLGIVSADDTGQTLTREWYVCGHFADFLAARLGAPDCETLMTAEAAAALDLRDAQMPGVIITNHQEG